MEEWRALNQANWDERVAVHLGPGGYDLASLHDGSARLDAIVRAELGPVAGNRVLHLQCHFGRDTLMLAREGAEVTGVDFSPPAIAAARALTEELGLVARFMQSDVYSAPDELPEPGSFDLVFTTWGTICWLPDITRWARVVAHFLKIGGALYFADAHPVAYVFDDAAAGEAQRPGWFVPYFSGEPLTHEDTADYVDQRARLLNARQVNWLHPVASILGALHGAGLRLEWLHEHGRITWRMFRALERDADGLWTWPDRPWLPLSLSLRAVRV